MALSCKWINSLVNLRDSVHETSPEAGRIDELVLLFVGFDFVPGIRFTGPRNRQKWPGH